MEATVKVLLISVLSSCVCGSRYSSTDHSSPYLYPSGGGGGAGGGYPHWSAYHNRQYMQPAYNVYYPYYNQLGTQSRLQARTSYENAYYPGYTAEVYRSGRPDNRRTTPSGVYRTQQPNQQPPHQQQQPHQQQKSHQNVNKPKQTDVVEREAKMIHYVHHDVPVQPQDPYATPVTPARPNKHQRLYAHPNLDDFVHDKQTVADDAPLSVNLELSIKPRENFKINSNAIHKKLDAVKHDVYVDICQDIMSDKMGSRQISYDMKEILCGMYKQWGNNMKKTAWQPTDKQMAWFQSLGRKPKRSKRQVDGATPALRKEYRAMTDAERNAFHRAMNQLKTTSMDGLSLYDLFTYFHQARQAPGAHFGPAFLGYHRVLLSRFEAALRQMDPSISLPYWDSNLDHHLGDDLAQMSVLWTDDFAGNGKGEVITGPYAYWNIPFESEVQDSPFITRNLTVAPPFARTAPNLMSDEAILSIVEAESVRSISWFIDPTFEGHHGAVHNWVGGIMSDLPVSPSDPLFFMHHAFIDCLWEQMRQSQRHRGVDPRFDYPNDTEVMGVGMVQPDGNLLQDPRDSPHFSVNTMQPFGDLLNIDSFNDDYYGVFYTCQNSPSCSQANPSCGSQYFFCDITTDRCAPKLQDGADCSRFSQSVPCMSGSCCRGICAISCDSPDRQPTVTTRATPRQAARTTPRALPRATEPNIRRELVPRVISREDLRDFDNRNVFEPIDYSQYETETEISSNVDFDDFMITEQPRRTEPPRRAELPRRTEPPPPRRPEPQFRITDNGIDESPFLITESTRRRTDPPPRTTARAPQGAPTFRTQGNPAANAIPTLEAVGGTAGSTRSSNGIVGVTRPPGFPFHLVTPVGFNRG